MVTRAAEAEWKGDLPSGSGTVALGSGAFKGQYSFKSRFEDGTGTNPEELLGAAHAGCFTMALSHILSGAGYPPERVHTQADVSVVKEGEGFTIDKIKLTTRGTVPGISDEEFTKHAEAAKAGCPLSKALAATAIELDAALA